VRSSTARAAMSVTSSLRPCKPVPRPDQANPATTSEPLCNHVSWTSPIRVLKEWVGLQTRSKPQ
jgi:hypothetical protein